MLTIFFFYFLHVQFLKLWEGGNWAFKRPRLDKVYTTASVFIRTIVAFNFTCNKKKNMKKYTDSDKFQFISLTFITAITPITGKTVRCVDRRTYAQSKWRRKSFKVERKCETNKWCKCEIDSVCAERSELSYFSAQLQKSFCFFFITATDIVIVVCASSNILAVHFKIFAWKRENEHLHD